MSMSAIKNLVETYADLVHPNDAGKADELVESLFLGKVEMTIEQLLTETSRLTHARNGNGAIPRTKNGELLEP